jgi:hypothetical protein
MSVPGNERNGTYPLFRFPLFRFQYRREPFFCKEQYFDQYVDRLKCSFDANGAELPGDADRRAHRSTDDRYVQTHASPSE